MVYSLQYQLVIKVAAAMIEPDDQLLAFRDGLVSRTIKEQQRLKALLDLGLRQPETIPVFEEATQTAAHFLEAPISILGFIDQERHWFKSAVGLSRLGLMNHLAQNRQMLRYESFCTYVVESLQIFVINDTLESKETAITSSQLVQNYGIRSYLGAPLIDASGNCLGALAVMDLVPRNFTSRDIELLQVIARWSMSEFERNQLLEGKAQTVTLINRSKFLPKEEQSINPSTFKKDFAPARQLKLQILAQLTQDLRTPLTSVMGMASVLGREIYGPLTSKQREYLEIIEHSGRQLLSLINEIIELGAADETASGLNLVPVDIEMLCQQAINFVEETANRREQYVRLSIGPGRSRICLLDKDKVRQILYHLLFSVIQLSATGSIVRLHVSQKEDTLKITVSVSHPWLGDGITEVDPYFRLNSLPPSELAEAEIQVDNQEQMPLDTSSNMGSSQHHATLSRESLGVLLSCQLAELHEGKISIQGSPESGYRYVLSLPLQTPTSSTISPD